MKEDKKKKEGIKQMITSIGMDKLLLLALCGVVLVIVSIPDGNRQKTGSRKENALSQETEALTVSGEDYFAALERRVEELLSGIDGVKRVRVMITLKSSGEKVALKESTYEPSDSKQQEGEMQKEENTYQNREVVVYEKDGQGNTIPYVVKETMPQIEGIAVVVKGGMTPEMNLQITSTLLALFHVEAHKISVIGMR